MYQALRVTMQLGDRAPGRRAIRQCGVIPARAIPRVYQTGQSTRATLSHNVRLNE